GTQNKIMTDLLNLLQWEEKPAILDDIDFETIQDYSKKMKANILIGNSDGKFITEKEGIPLVRVGFPIHDRMGGQRKVITGYNGTMALLDEITNTLIDEKYGSYRKMMYDKYFKDEEKERESVEKSNKLQEIDEKTATHPCYSGGACRNARMHIPVAPACNIACNYCNRKYDCNNESRPGVTSKVLSPEEALRRFVEVKQKVKNLKVIGIAGPGDALANFENTKKSIELIKQVDPNITFCLSTNGLMLPYYADEIVNLGVTHVTITINSIDPKIGAKIYRNINYYGVQLTGEKAAEILTANQIIGLKMLSKAGVKCKVNIVMIKGINDEHIEKVVEKVKECGAFMTNIMPLIPAEGSAFENMLMTTNKELNELRNKCGIHLKQMYHCKQCRADAIGTLDNDQSLEFAESGCGAKAIENNESDRVYRFAVASKTGMFVDQHFGHVENFYIYSFENDKAEFIEKRQVKKYCAGNEDCDDKEGLMRDILEAVSDCDSLLVMRIGYDPLKELEKSGVNVIQTCGRVEEGMRQAIKVLGEKRVATCM
ncbi:MAG: nitrogenase cofactor biosynthesis protein NifB, partial [Bacillota bacterium]|nr:nitrogenase cofactor biosynthesis protein NifB [Bacillota bacterium]